MPVQARLLLNCWRPLLYDAASAWLKSVGYGSALFNCVAARLPLRLVKLFVPTFPPVASYQRPPSPPISRFFVLRSIASAWKYWAGAFALPVMEVNAGVV